MKLPKLQKPKAPAKPSPKLQARMPRALEDLYRDMRDRRLLLPALLLVVAIVAVPIALTAPKEAPPAPLAFTPPEGSEAVASAVLAEQPIGVRDYRQRLDELKRKNPFASNFAFPKDAPESSPSSASPAVDPAAGSGGSGGSTLPNTDTVQPDNPVGDAATATGGSGGSGSGGSGGSTVLVLAPRIDVSAGAVGNRKDIEDVELGDLLPDRRKAPVVMFLGASDDLKFAEFLVSGDVTETDGDGSCRPRPDACEFLRLREGQKRSFVYEPTGRRYVVKVEDIREEVVDRRKVSDE